MVEAASRAEPTAAAATARSRRPSSTPSSDPSSTPPVDLAYFEFTDPYADWDWAAVEFHELFNMSA